MLNIVYLVIFVLGNQGITSETIPQANMNQCQINAKQFNTNRNNQIIQNGYNSNVKTQSAICIIGVK